MAIVDHDDHDIMWKVYIVSEVVFAETVYIEVAMSE